MDLILNDENVLEYFNKWHYIPWRRIDKNYKDYLLNRFKDKNIYEDEHNTLKECLYRLKNNIEEIPKCPICGKNKKSYIYWYGASCGNIECSTKIQYQTFLNNIHIKYGNDIDNYSQLPEIKEKVKQTCLKRYGTTSPLKNKEIWNKTRQHTIEHCGCAYNKEKLNQTLLEKYGVPWFTLHDKLKKNASSKEAKDKCYKTQKKNGTINKSKEEDKTYELLKKKFNIVERNYKCDKYPFSCDFYIPDLDLFIECQYSMFHNKRPYLGTEEDLKEIEILKQKSIKRKQQNGNKKTRYDSVIDTWINRDPLKRKIAKQNNLNYLEFFTILEFEKWLNNYESK